MKIGNIEINGKVVLAPMAGICNEAFREICKENGADLIYSEMVSDKAIVFQNPKSLKMTQVSDKEHPIALQIFGSNLDTFVQAAQYADKNSACDIIDINMGCPVPKVAISCQAGAALMKSPKKIYEIVSKISESVSKPVTIKIRLGWDESSINCVEVAKIAEKAGAKAISVHARTRSQQYTGKARWEWIKKVKESVSIPVIGNGDVDSPEAAVRMLNETGCDAVMIARASQGNPWIFNQVKQFIETGKYDPKPEYKVIKATIIDHARRLINLKGEKIAMNEMRAHVVHYLKSLPNSKIFKNKFVGISSFEGMIVILDEYEEYLKGENNG